MSHDSLADYDTSTLESMSTEAQRVLAARLPRMLAYLKVAAAIEQEIARRALVASFPWNQPAFETQAERYRKRKRAIVLERLAAAQEHKQGSP